MAPSNPAEVKKLVQTKLTWLKPASDSSTSTSKKSSGLAFLKTDPRAETAEEELGDPMDVDSQATTISWASSNYSMDLDEKPKNLPTTNTKSSIVLALVAAETKQVLPSFLKQIPSAPPEGRLYDDMHALHQHRNPQIPDCHVAVMDIDSLDLACLMLESRSPATAGPARPKPPLVLNMANATHRGGGWLAGAVAQEEALCYRSSLSFTLKWRFYPIPDLGAIYSPTVVVIRQSMASGHKLMNGVPPTDLPVVSVVSIAAIRDPSLSRTLSGEGRYKRDGDRRLMKEKMRVILRIAGRENHRQLVLGALGCGAFGNPSEEVARMWKEVLQEKEWKGWFSQIVFAVLDGGSGNWAIFDKELGGMKI